MHILFFKHFHKTKKDFCRYPCIIHCSVMMFLLNV